MKMDKKKVLVGIPDRLLEQLDLLAQHRAQTRSELIREALRAHLDRAMSNGAPVTVWHLPAAQQEKELSTV